MHGNDSLGLVVTLPRILVTVDIVGLGLISTNTTAHGHAAGFGGGDKAVGHGDYARHPNLRKCLQSDKDGSRVPLPTRWQCLALQKVAKFFSNSWTKDPPIKAF